MATTSAGSHAHWVADNGANKARELSFAVHTLCGRVWSTIEPYDGRYLCTQCPKALAAWRRRWVC